MRGMKTLKTYLWHGILIVAIVFNYDIDNSYIFISWGFSSKFGSNLELFCSIYFACELNGHGRRLENPQCSHDVILMCISDIIFMS